MSDTPRNPRLGPITGLPLNPGSVVPVSAPANLTEDEKNSLKALGWKEGQPIPGDLPVRLEKARKAAVADAVAFRSPLPPDTPPVKQPVTHELASMSKEQLDQLRSSLAQAGVEMERMKKSKSAGITGAGPGINEAIAAGLAAEAERARNPVNISSETKPKPPDEKVSTSRLFDQPPKEECPKQDTTAGASFHVCSRCGWDDRTVYPFEDRPTDEDRDRYMACFLSGRFRKVYELYGGKILVVFKSLTKREEDLALIQLGLDMRKNVQENKIKDQVTYVSYLLAYRTAMGLERIIHTTAGPDGDITLPAFDPSNYIGRFSPETDTALRPHYEALIDSVLSNPSLGRVVEEAYGRFTLLQGDLEREARDRNFTKPVEHAA